MAEDFPYLIRNFVDWLWCVYEFSKNNDHSFFAGGEIYSQPVNKAP